MRQKLLQKIGLSLGVLMLSFMLLPGNGFSADDGIKVDGFNIMPELTTGEIKKVDEAIQEVGSGGGKVWEEYKRQAENLTTKEQITSGIMNWDTIMNYLVFIVQFLSQLGLVVGGLFIMYAGYKYMLSVFDGGKVPKETIKNAIIGILIVIFSYAIMKTLTSFIGIS